MIYYLSAHIGKESFTTEISNDRHILIADEPESLGGKDLGFAPFELFLSSLAACKAMTMRMYADRKQWPLEKINIDLTLEVKLSNQQQTTYINANIELIGDLDNEQKQRILAIADKCPIHKLMQHPIAINSNLVTK